MKKRWWLPAAVLLVATAGCAAPAGTQEDATSTASPDASAAATADVTLVGHRGAADVAPENTVPSFEAGAEAGVDLIEVDVQLSADGVPFLFHDDTAERTTNVADVFPDRVDDPITSFTWAELQQLDAGAFFRDEFAGTPIASLDDAALTVGPDIGVDIELKAPENSPGVEQVVADALSTEAWAPLVDAGLVVVSSFDVDATRAFHDLRPDVPAWPIVDAIPDAAWVDGIADHASGIVTNYANLTADGVALASAADLPVWVYTVDDAGSMLAQVELGATGIITDVPALAAQALGRTD
ncbi:Glycerophosphodiester phosphodiesterase [Beutenbergia cavernae DSM 12333]|uniref:Glycerophosphodiester phosphodiesterase n=1 Tax=Beutenbergia cavernae (strain ATCC BAA-8 / DSM 12333 / CCUG 43141 / JCM 11478 / NBRC 16432 / NCIMB 13614 / HKI 0122) TaxID=471853 RepID=C5C1K9_BEUC1|nr:glycerophosphodiester phosphodiesterase family protein [Beutenbergia cavernae]ACQ79477.1 Glycerophosphodiester phosphodiesterase [Beutenbergia cavernae DSM 12333]